MIEVPNAIPVTTPVTGSMVAVLGVPEVHVPPAVASDKVVVAPAHTTKVPVIPPGGGMTFIVIKAEQPELPDV